MRILLVDDSISMRAIERRVVEQFVEFDVRESCSLRDAVQELRQTRPDLVIADGCLPELSPREVVLQLRTHGCTAPIVMIMPEHPDASVYDFGSLASDVHTLTKPFTPDVLYQRIEQALADAGAMAG